MKKILGFLFLSFIFAASQSFAQTTILRPAVAFVKAARDTLFIKQADSAVQAFDLHSITNNVGSFILVDSVRQLAVIGMKPDGSRMILGGNFYYYDNKSSSHVSYSGLISIPWPLDQSLKDPTKTIQFLLPTPSANGFRPEGILSKDGSQWWATLQSYSQAQLTPVFYHGNTDGSGKIDSTTPENVQGDDRLQSGVQFSNLALDTKTNTMLAMSFSGVQSSSQYTSFYIYFYTWSVGNDVQADNFTGSFKSKFVPTPSPGNENPIVDSLFGMTVIPNNNGSTCLLGFTSDPTNSIDLYQTPYTTGSIGFSNQGQIPDDILPSGEDFFSGENCPPSYVEAVATNGEGQPGNAGDVFVNSIGGDSVLFVTHESSDNCSDRNAKSGIYYHNYTNTNDSAHLVYNDPKGQELQPVWVVMPYIVPQYPGIAWQGTQTTNFGTVDTGKTNSLTLTVIDSGKVPVTIDSATMGGPNAAEMMLGSLTYPIVLQPQGTQSFTVTFQPMAPSGSRKGGLKIYFEGETHDSLTQMLTGTANVPANSVAQDPALSASMTTQPNPFSASASISLTAPEAGAMNIVVHDAVGRVVYRSDVREAGAGEAEAFTFDAKSLGLPDGVYYITAFLDNRQATREVVFAR
ncbi:MAG TPA: hypothetical protein VGM92_09915 [Candidatus Kapabacteria bacterium]|jgi:hypothetical protein